MGISTMSNPKPSIMPNDFNEEALFRIIWRANDPESTFHKAPVKIVLSGTDALVHRFLEEYVRLLRDRVDLFDELDLRVFIVPVRDVKNTLASYIASIDYWY
jgi:hypothetical protein